MFDLNHPSYVIVSHLSQRGSTSSIPDVILPTWKINEIVFRQLKSSPMRYLSVEYTRTTAKVNHIYTINFIYNAYVIIYVIVIVSVLNTNKNVRKSNSQILALITDYYTTSLLLRIM